jgi:phage gpG-like protein
LAAKKKTSTKKTTKKAAKKTTKKSATTKETRKKLQSESAFTYYWIAQPEDYSGGKKVAVKTCSGQTIGSVAEKYADALVMEGTGVVGSKIVNLGGCNCSGYKCFELVDKKSDPYGLTSFGTPLRPYVTIASNDIKKNTKIYVPALVGWKVPGSGKVHNGCLLVDGKIILVTSISRSVLLTNFLFHLQMNLGASRVSTLISTSIP